MASTDSPAMTLLVVFLPAAVILICNALPTGSRNSPFPRKSRSKLRLATAAITLLLISAIVFTGHVMKKDVSAASFAIKPPQFKPVLPALGK